jgi:hypothetical protein
MNFPNFPVLERIPLGTLVDNLCAGAAPYATIDYELASFCLRAKNVHLVAHLQKVTDKEWRLWRIDDWNAIEEIRKSKRAEMDATRAANMALSDKFSEVKSIISKKLGEEIAHKFTSLLFSAKTEQERETLAKVLNVDIASVNHLFDTKPTTYEVVVTYKGKTIKLW